MNRNIIIPGIMAICMIALFSYMSAGLSLIVTFVPGVLLACVFYYLFCYRHNPDPARVLPMYLLGIGFQLLHFAEEHATHFDEAFARLFNAAPYNHNLFVSFNMVSYCMFLLGGYAIYKGIKPMMLIAMFFVAYGMLGNCIGHIGYSIAVKGYFSGLYTAFPNFVLSFFLLRAFWCSRHGAVRK